MAISPVANEPVTAAQLQPKQAGNNVNVNNKINNPLVAPHNDSENDGDRDDRGVKKVTSVQPQAPRSPAESSVSQTINKFA